MVKPDGVQRGLVGKIIQRFEEKGFKLLAMKMVWVSDRPQITQDILILSWVYVHAVLSYSLRHFRYIHGDFERFVLLGQPRDCTRVST